MKVQIIGTGIVGEATAYLSHSLGYETYGYDIKDNHSEYYSTGLVHDADIVFICVGEKVVEDVIAELVSKKVQGLYVVRSTIKPFVISWLRSRHGVNICHNPEFLREAFSKEDAVNPHFILVGCDGDCDELREFYKPYSGKVELVQTSLEYSSLVKLLINVYLACLVSFWCEVDQISKAVGVDSQKLAKIMSNDPRVSTYGYNPIGKGFSGRCLPKDLRQIIGFSHSIGVNPKVFEAVENFNKEVVND